MDINAKIKEIKERVKLLTSHFPYNDYEHNLITLAYLAITMLDPNIDDMLDEVISSTFIYLTSESLSETYKKIYPKTDEFYLDYLKDADAISYGYDFNKRGNLELMPLIIIENDIPINRLLDAILHELKHRINEVIIKYNGKSFYSGLNLKSYDKDAYNNIDEAFNCFLVKIYLNNLLALKTYDIEDEDIKVIIKGITEIKGYYYPELLQVCLPLFQSKNLFWAFYNACLYKDMETLQNALEEAFSYQVSWKSFFKALDREDYDELDEMEGYLDFTFIDEEYKLPRI